MAMINLGGRPKTYTPEEFEAKVIEYFKFVEDENVQRKIKRFEGEKVKPFTLSGICVYLGIARDTWNEYSKQEGYAETTKVAKMIVENYAEEGLLNGTLNAIGAIFNLKNNFGWVDKIEVSASAGGEQLNQQDIQSRLSEIKRKQLNSGKVEVISVENVE
jgi:nitrogen regulatory protein PII-like uncharacterized protein